jgi:hypothetical protein
MPVGRSPTAAVAVHSTYYCVTPPTPTTPWEVELPIDTSDRRSWSAMSAFICAVLAVHFWFAPMFLFSNPAR